MKILHLISGGDTGGAKTHIMSLMSELDKLVEIKIICFIEGKFYYDLLKAGINIEVIEQKSRVDFTAIKKLKEETTREDYDIIHCHGARANFIAMFLGGGNNRPLITTVHSDYKLDFKDNFYKNIIYTGMNSMALKKFDHYIAVSDTFKEMLIDRGFQRKNISTVYNGIDLQAPIKFINKTKFLKRYNIDGKNKLIIGIAGRLDLVKDHETFIEGAKKVLEKRKNVIFLVAGTGNNEERLKNLTQKYDIEDSTHFLGFVEDPYSFFNAIDVNVLTSESESFPYVILEGGKLKKTIISTEVGGINQLVENGHNGWLIPVKDSQALSERIIFFIDNKDKIDTMGEELFKTIKEKYSSKIMAKEHFKIYNEVINEA